VNRPGSKTKPQKVKRKIRNRDNPMTLPGIRVHWEMGERGSAAGERITAGT
jgi:hypothetical protein